MTDRPLFIPTSKGPIGAIVSEPPGEARAGLILFAGAGRPARSGVNSFWTRTARDLCSRGLVVLRFDYPREGETLPLGEGIRGQAQKWELDRQLFVEIMPWFQERLGGLDLFLAGSCSGARGAIELAGREYPDEVARTFLIVPHLRVLEGVECRPLDHPGWSELEDPESVDPAIVDELRTILSGAPCWILVGERDRPDVAALRRLLGSTAHPLEVEVVPGAAMHLLDQPAIQDEARRRLIAGIVGALAQPAPSPS